MERLHTKLEMEHFVHKVVHNLPAQFGIGLNFGLKFFLQGHVTGFRSLFPFNYVNVKTRPLVSA